MFTPPPKICVHPPNFKFLEFSNTRVCHIAPYAVRRRVPSVSPPCVEMDYNEDRATVEAHILSNAKALKAIHRVLGE